MHLKKLTNLNTNYLENFKNLKKIEKISLKKELIHNLVKKNKKIPSKFHYDLDGSKYFEKITKLKEYYISRTEKKILKKISNNFKKIFKDNITFVEFGSGAAEKISILIKEQVKFYVPLDISYDFLLKSSIKLAKSFLKLKIIPVYCDYINYFKLPIILSKNKIGFFLGSSIGNFYNNEEKKFLQNAKKILGKNSFLFVGVDLVKNKKILEKAYNDSKGISAKFNLNLIKRINRELQTNLNQKNFKYTSQFNKQNSSVGCYLICKKKIEFTIGGKKISIKVNEKIQTEISKKFTLRSFENLSNSAGWTVKKNWLDKKNNYAIILLESKK